MPNLNFDRDPYSYNSENDEDHTENEDADEGDEVELDPADGEYLTGLLAQLSCSNDSKIISTLEFISTMLIGGDFLLRRDFLSMANFISGALIKLLRDSDNINVQLLTVRCISYIYEEIPHKAPAIFIEHGILSVLSSKFENMSYMDLIEQLIFLLRPLAAENASGVLNHGCLLPLIQYLDFFGAYFQGLIMSAVEECAVKVNKTTIDSARKTLSMLPSPPNETTLKCTALLIAKVASLQGPDGGTVVTDDTWNTLVSNIEPNVPHLDSVLYAVESLIIHEEDRLPDLVLLAENITYAIFQKLGANPYDPKMVAKLSSHPSATLQCAVNIFAALFASIRKITKYDIEDLYRCADIIIPLAVSMNSYFSKIAPVINKYDVDRKRQILSLESDHNISETTPIISSRRCVKAILHRLRISDIDLTRFAKLVVGLRIFDFLHEVMSSCLGFNDIGVEIVFDLTRSSPSIKKALKESGIADEISGYIARLQNPISVSEILNGNSADQSSHQDTTEHRKFCQSVIDAIQPNANHTQRVIDEALFCISNKNDIDFDNLKHIPVDELFKQGFFDMLATNGVKKYFGSSLVQFLVNSFERVETFPITKTEISARTPDEPLNSRIIKLTAKPLRSSNPLANSVLNFTVRAFTQVEELEHFIKVQLINARRNAVTAYPIVTDFFGAAALLGGKIVFYNKKEKRIPNGTSIMKAVHGLNESVIYYKHVDSSDTGDEQDEFEDFADPYELSPELATIIGLLKQVALLNYQSGTLIPWSDFNSCQLSTKLMVQLNELEILCAGMLPLWVSSLVQSVPFLFALTLRCYYVHLISLKLDLNIPQASNDLDIHQGADTNEAIIRPRGLYRRQRFRIRRDSFFGSALILLERTRQNTDVVEVQFTGEDGVGKGPTQEFFSLASTEFSSLSTGMWNVTDKGLFFKPYTSCPAHVSESFKGLGILIARALLDRRILDFRFNPTFFECILSNSDPSIELLHHVDSELADTLEIIKLAQPTDIASMGLDFTVPGTGEELLPSGADIPLSKDNYKDYIKLICNFFLGSGIKQQIISFTEGFDSLIPISRLRCFMFDELTQICGWDEHQDWSTDALKNAIVPEQGYNREDPVFNNFIEVLNSFDHTERRLFLMFTTGSPTLPLGGFKGLKPPLSIAVKYPDDESLDSDVYLPSVMTCANYFRLPKYSTKEVMKTRLLKAFIDGANAFTLS